MTDPTFGIAITRVSDQPSPAVTSDMSVVGLIGSAPAANATMFPLNTPVFLYSDDTAALTALGTTGTLPDAIEGINDQLGDFEVAAKIVVVRIDPGASDDAAITNIVGSSLNKTGIWAFLQAGPVLGVIPRLIGAPGFTYQQQSGLSALTLGTQGSGMTAAPTVVFTGGGSDPAKVLPTAHAVLGTGADADKVTSLVIDSPGSHLSGTITVSFTGGGIGTPVLPTAAGVISVLANAVCAALPPVLNSLLAHAIVDGPATTLQAYTNWRETIQEQRIIPLETAVLVGAPAVQKPGSPRVLGIAVRRDFQFNGRPFHSWANQAVAGIVGPNRAIPFSLTDGATEGQTILSENGGVIVRGEMGVESAIASGGFVYVGTDTCSEDPLWQFYNVSRGRDFIHLMFLRTLRQFLGTRNIDQGAITDIVQTMQFALRDLKASGDILDYKVGFSRDVNSPEQLRLGKFTVDFAAEEPPVLRYLGIRSARYRPALDTLLNDLLQQIDTAA